MGASALQNAAAGHYIRVQASLMDAATHRILVFTLSNIGDAVMTTPVLEALHKRYPEALIELVADRRSSDIFTHCPYRGRIHFKDKPANWRNTLRLVRSLRQTHYDLVVDLRTDGLAYVLHARRRLTKRQGLACGPHAVEQHMGVIAALGITEIPAPQIWLTAQHQRTAEQHLKQLPGQRWLALGPGANWEPKIWPVENFQHLITNTQAKFDGVFLLGSTADSERCTTIARHCPLPVLNLAGETGLLEAAAVLARASLFVGNDSGLGHLASAVGTPSLTLFGPGRPERYRPWGEQAHWLRSAENDLKRLRAEEVTKTAIFKHIERSNSRDKQTYSPS